MENFRDAELKKWLAEEYEKETEEMEKKSECWYKMLMEWAMQLL